jgi:hypothetical protein
MSAINRRTWLTLPWAGTAGVAGCAWWPREALVPVPVPVIRLCATVAT